MKMKKRNNKTVVIHGKFSSHISRTLLIRKASPSFIYLSLVNYTLTITLLIATFRLFLGVKRILFEVRHYNVLSMIIKKHSLIYFAFKLTYLTVRMLFLFLFLHAVKPQVCRPGRQAAPAFANQQCGS